jgi:hypothetical protein
MASRSADSKFDCSVESHQKLLSTEPSSLGVERRRMKAVNQVQFTHLMGCPVSERVLG